MRSGLRTGVVTTAALTAAVVLYVFLTLPAPSLQLVATLPETHVMGAVHVHSVVSDGTGTADAIASAAARAGLSFVILTDHGDAARPPDRPRYVHGVLVIDAVEISSREGHIVALGLKGPAPYPLAGSARDVIEDLHRLGAAAVAAHPDSPKDSLRWRANNAPFDGIEWLNVDSEWRDESPGQIIGGAIRSLIRPSESIAALFSRPVASLRRWDQAARVRPVFGLAALDAHARIGWREEEEPRQRTALARPSYESMFRTVVNVVTLERPLVRDAERDAERVLAGLRAGRSYAVVRAFAEPGYLTFRAVADGRSIQAGERVSEGASVQFLAGAQGAPGARVVLLRDSQPVDAAQGELQAAHTESGVYRVEVYLPGRTMPWIVSNSIALGAIGGQGGRATLPGTRGGRGTVTGPGPIEPVPVEPASARWSVEQDPLSRARTFVQGGNRTLEFTLGAGPAYGQYAALVLGEHDGSGIEELTFRADADRPMRISVQVRLPGGRDGQRWQRSVYLDQASSNVTLRLQDFEPVGRATSPRPIVAPIQALLFVVDTVNTRPGTTGRLRVSGLTLGVNRLQDKAGR